MPIRPFLNGEQATEPSIKSAYEKVAEHWMLLARLESLVAAGKNSEDA